MAQGKIEIPALFASIIICMLAGLAGSFFTEPAIEGWYSALEKPWFSPPNWVFAPVWTSLYLMMGVSAYLVWEKGFTRKDVRYGLSLFGLQLLLNAFWSAAFFGLRSPLAGMLVIGALWLALAATIREFSKISEPAGWLLTPYILWISFAAILNFSVVLLNP